jgi:hypothetical protein
MNSAFRTLLLESDARLTTDTQMMSAIVATVPGTVLHLDVPGLFDVDDQRTLTRAELLTRGDPVG